MSSVNASIIINLPDGQPYQEYIDQIKTQISKITGLETKISIKEIDDPLSTSIIRRKADSE